MVFRWIINAGLLALPIGATVGVLMGMDLHRNAQGQAPLFTPAPGGGKVDGGGSGSAGDNRYKENTYCDLQVGVAPPSKGKKYTCECIGRCAGNAGVTPRSDDLLPLVRIVTDLFVPQ